ncbi:hypothetical protein HanHA300_Chr16g0592401 [Helianthus annuus]|nr:hypothetical protein HanHA300_Chr16g0592401 [Helianthus annuus]
MMGFAVGASPPLHFPSSSQPLFFNFCHTKPHDFTKTRKVYACIQPNEPNDDVFCHRRAILFMGISVLPFLNLKAKAFENLAPHESGMLVFKLDLGKCGKSVIELLNLDCVVL